MVALEEGPFGIFNHFRNLFLKQGWIARGVRCPLCLSFWLGFAGAPFVAGATESVGSFITVALGLSGLAVVLQKLEGK
jgi:hypothetical protein